jgi:hypothetical protein
MYTKIDIAKIIVENVLKWSGKKLERNYMVLKLLKKIGADQLGNDHDSIYAHTLVEYGVDAAPPELTRLFAFKEVKATFLKDQYKEDPGALGKILEERIFADEKFKAFTVI